MFVILFCVVAGCESGELISCAEAETHDAESRTWRKRIMAGMVTFILGLCGSGKSELIRRLDADRKFDEGFAWNRHGEHEDLIAALQSGEHCALIEVAYCLPGPRGQFLERITRAVPGLTVRWICFENDLAQANRNCVHRNDGRDLEMLFGQNQLLSAAYTYPSGAEIRPVWRPEP